MVFSNQSGSKILAKLFIGIVLFFTSLQGYSSSKKYHITYETQKSSDTISCYYSNTCCLHTISQNGSSYFKLLVDFKEEIIKKYLSYYSSQSNAFEKYVFEDSFLEYEEKLKTPSEYDYLFPELERDQELKCIKHSDTKQILGKKCYHMEVWHGDIRSDIWYFKPKGIKKDRINKFSGFDIIPGIILEVFVNNELIRKAIHIDNNWFETCE